MSIKEKANDWVSNGIDLYVEQTRINCEGTPIHGYRKCVPNTVGLFSLKLYAADQSIQIVPFRLEHMSRKVNVPLKDSEITDVCLGITDDKMVEYIATLEHSDDGNFMNYWGSRFKTNLPLFRPKGFKASFIGAQKDVLLDDRLCNFFEHIPASRFKNMAAIVDLNMALGLVSKQVEYDVYQIGK